MYKTGTEQHFFTVRGRGFDHKQWKAVTELSQGIVARAKEAGISATFEADARRIMITSSEEGVSPLVIWRKGEPGIPKEVTTRGGYDKLVQSILTATKKVAPDIFEMTAPDGRDYRRLLAKSNGTDLPEIKEISKQNRLDKDRAFLQSVKRQKWPNPEYRAGSKAQRHVEFVSLPKKEQTEIRHRWDAEYGKRFDDMAERAMKKLRDAEKAKTDAKREKDQAADAAEAFQHRKPKTPAVDMSPKKAKIMTEDSIRKAAIRVAATTDDPNLKLALLEILRDSTDIAPKAAAKDDEKKSRHEEGKSVDIGDYLKSKGHDEDAAKWEEHEGEMGKKSNVAIVFPAVHDLAWRHVIQFSKTNPSSKTASGSTADRVVAADSLARKWVQEALGRVATIQATIPAGKLESFIAKVRAKGDQNLFVACLVAQQLQATVKVSADDAWLNEESFTKAATEMFGADKLSKDWIQDAIKRPGRVREYLGVPAGQDIPVSKLDSAITKVKGGDDKSLLSALLLAKRLKKMNKGAGAMDVPKALHKTVKKVKQVGKQLCKDCAVKKTAASGCTACAQLAA